MPCHPRTLFYLREISSSTSVHVLLGSANVALAIFTIFGNSLILHALRKCRNLHAPTKALFCSLALSDLGVGIVVYPLFATYCFAVAFNNVEVFCTVHDPYAISSFFLGSVSFMTMTGIALDRYYAFTLRLRYRQIVTFKRVVFFLAACWTFGFIWPFSWLPQEKICKIVATVVVFCCVVITSIAYIKIAIEIPHHQCQIQGQQTNPASQQHGGNHFRIIQYKKLLNTTILIFCLLLACYLPYFTVSTVTMVTGSSSIKVLMWNITAGLVYVNSLLNPLIYSWRMREIRREVVIALPCLANLI